MLACIAAVILGIHLGLGWWTAAVAALALGLAPYSPKGSR